MSKCVVRMEMPQNCLECKFSDFDGEDDVCLFTGVSCLSIGRQADCPILCQLPEGHGRLVDADELKQHVRNVVREIVDNQPTIVPAERSET